MTDPNQFFDPDHDWLNEEEEEIEVDEIRCIVCQGTFMVPSDADPDECPLCGEKFLDGEI